MAGGRSVVRVAASRADRSGGLAGSVDLDQGVAKVERTLGQTSGGVCLSDVKTKTSRRRVLFAEEIGGLLREWRKKQVAERLAGGAGWNDGAWSEHDFLFTTEPGEPVHPRNKRRAEAARMATALLGVRPAGSDVAGEVEEVTNVVRMAR
jgi:hypothetical protein